MSLIGMISILMVLVGIGFLSASISGGFRLNRKLPDELRGRWQLMTAFMVFFDVGYIIFVFLLMSTIHFPVELLVGLILLGGAVFVFLFIKLSEHTVARMTEMQRDVGAVNAQLQESNRVLAEQVRERERISAELRKSRSNLDNLFNNSIPLCITNTERDIIAANTAYYRIFGKPAVGVVQKCYESRPGSTCKTSECPLTRIVAGIGEVVCESRKREADGTENHFMVTARPFKDEEGEIAGIVESFQDITTLKAVEEALAEEKERLLVTLKSIADGVITVDVNGRVVMINDTAQALTGWKQEYAAGRELAEILILLDGGDRRQSLDPVGLVLGRKIGEETGVRAILVARDGWERHVNYSVSPIHDGRAEIIGAVLVFQDITENLKVEAEAARIQKLESVGLLAGGIAHDFNNILTAIMNNLSLARLMKDSREKLLEKITSTEQAVLRAKGLTGQLLTFAKGGAPMKKVIFIGALVKDSVEFALRGSNVGSDILIAEDLWPVEVDGTQIHQVISNLVINADQAMVDGGMVRVAADNSTVGRGAKELVSPGDYVRITVSDEGPGIEEKHLANIFDPYFTTKAEGSGLGLATVYSIISQHGGHIFVDAEYGRGAEFTIYLPAVKGGSEQPGAEQPGLLETDPKKEKAAAGGGRILIMDDEADIRELLAELLELAGFEVESAVEGGEAVRRYREAAEAGRRFDCVIMDLTVPGGMGGKEAMIRILDLDPGVRAIVSSGYSNDPVMADYQSYGFAGRVAKPYQFADLVQTINEVSGLRATD